METTIDTLVVPEKTVLPEIVAKFQNVILEDWLKEQMTSANLRLDLIKESELQKQSVAFMNAFVAGTKAKKPSDIDAPEWKAGRELLMEISRTRSEQGFTPTETAMFIFSLKQPIFKVIRRELTQNAIKVADEMWMANVIIDKLGLFSTELYLKSREEVIRRQQEDLLELSTPVVKLWDGILALPMIGTLDSARTQTVMESLLQSILSTGAEVAIIDITGVPNVDTLVAQHLLKTVTAARLMGADCIISGIRPQIAQTIVHLGVDLGDITTKATLADAFVIALQRTGQTVGKATAKKSFTV